MILIYGVILFFICINVTDKNEVRGNCDDIIVHLADGDWYR